MDRLEQSSMSFNPRQGDPGRLANGVYRGKILPNGVKYRDTGAAKQTLVDLFMYDLMPPLMSVPVLTQKINRDNGEYTDPEPDDLVAVAFFGGNIYDPVVVGFLPPANNTIQSLAAEAPRYHRRRNGTDEKVEKDGTRRVYVAKDEVLEVEGHGTVTIKTGNLTINVLAGNTTVTTKGKTIVKSEGTVEVDGATGSAITVKGIVQGDCICPFIRKPHIHISATVKGSK